MGQEVGGLGEYHGNHLLKDLRGLGDGSRGECGGGVVASFQDVEPRLCFLGR